MCVVENHQTQSHYNQSIIAKMFVADFLNHYVPCFYAAVHVPVCHLFLSVYYLKCFCNNIDVIGFLSVIVYEYVCSICKLPAASLAWAPSTSTVVMTITACQ
jgi:hypothetical protein